MLAVDVDETRPLSAELGEKGLGRHRAAVRLPGDALLGGYAVLGTVRLEAVLHFRIGPVEEIDAECDLALFQGMCERDEEPPLERADFGNGARDPQLGQDAHQPAPDRGGKARGHSRHSVIAVRQIASTAGTPDATWSLVITPAGSGAEEGIGKVHGKEECRQAMPEPWGIRKAGDSRGLRRAGAGRMERRLPCSPRAPSEASSKAPTKASMRIEYHRTLLADRVRNEAFHAALKRVITPGKSLVADIGTGTGFLGFLANKLGAARVDMYDEGRHLGGGAPPSEANQLKGCRIATVHSTAVAEPDKVDVVVSETLGNYPFEENIIGTLNDARERYLKPGGVIIPGGRAVRLPRHGRAPLQRADDLGRRRFGLDFAPARAMSLNNIYVRWMAAGDLLDGARAARKWDEIDFLKAQQDHPLGEVSWTVTPRHRSTASRCGGVRSS